MSDMIEVAKATVSIIPNMEGSQQKIAKDLGAQVDPAAKQAGTSAGSSFASSMGTAITAGAGVVAGATAAISAAAVGAGKAIWDNANRVAEFGDNIDKTSQKIGISAEAFQEWDYVFNRSGADINKLQVGMKTLSGVITDATAGSEGAVNKLSAVGISIEEIGNLSQEDQLALVISRLQEMGSGAERTAAASDLLGKSAVDMAAVLNMSASDTQALIDEAHEYGMVLSDEGVAASAAFEDSLLKMSNTAAGVGNALMGSLLPSITSIMDGFSDLIAGKSGGAQAVAEGFTELFSNITAAIPAALTALESVIMALLPQLPILMNQILGTLNEILPQSIESLSTTILPTLINMVTMLVIQVAGSLPQLIMPLVNAIPQVVIPALTNGLMIALPAIIEGLLQLTLAIVAALPEIQQGLLDQAPQIIQDFVTAIMGCLPELIAGFVQLFVMLSANMPTIIMALVAATPQIVDGLIRGISQAWPAMLAEFQTLFSELVPIFAEIGVKMQETASKAVTAVTSAFKKLGTGIKSVLSTVISAITSWGSQMVARGKAAALQLVNTVVGTVKALPDKVRDIGKQIVEGIWSGIKSASSWLTDRLQEFCNGTIDSIKSFFKIESPSKVMRDEVGEMLVKGMAEGIERSQKVVNRAMEQAALMMNSSFDMTLALSGDAPSEGLRPITINNTVTVDGAQDPESWAGEFVRALNRQANMAMG